MRDEVMGTERMARQGLLALKAVCGVEALALALLFLAMAHPAPMIAQSGQPAVTVLKVANPFGSPQDFSFSGDLGDFDLDDDEARASPIVRSLRSSP